MVDVAYFVVLIIISEGFKIDRVLGTILDSYFREKISVIRISLAGITIGIIESLEFSVAIIAEVCI